MLSLLGLLNIQINTVAVRPNGPLCCFFFLCGNFLKVKCFCQHFYEMKGFFWKGVTL